jgi:hypothetical protein
MIICERDDLAEAAEFFADILCIPDTFVIAIAAYKEIGVCGYCIHKDDDIIPYCIIGLDQDETDIIETLAHEMVHAKQYATGELVDGGDHCYWQGKKYPEATLGSIDYYFSPWEVEAYGKQVGLIRLYNQREVV